jgi:putative endonuclease
LAQAHQNYKNMFSIYVLKSLKNNKRYTGYTSKTPQERLREHNSGKNNFTRQNRPFVLVYNERYETKTEAMKREIFLKSGQGRKFLDSIL